VGVFFSVGSVGRPDPGNDRVWHPGQVIPRSSSPRRVVRLATGLPYRRRWHPHPGRTDEVDLGQRSSSPPRPVGRSGPDNNRRGAYVETIVACPRPALPGGNTTQYGRLLAPLGRRRGEDRLQSSPPPFCRTALLARPTQGGLVSPEGRVWKVVDPPPYACVWRKEGGCTQSSWHLDIPILYERCPPAPYGRRRREVDQVTCVIVLRERRLLVRRKEALSLQNGDACELVSPVS
jgi:hypothetical protein